jgi:PhzF family phenazine biosynthesis protein
MKFLIINAFAEKGYEGNPAAVTLVENFPPDNQCQAIAYQINLSETVFIKRIKDNYFHIRWFSPQREVPLCGHGTLAAAHFLLENNALVENKPLTFDSLSGPLAVYEDQNSSLLTLDFPVQETTEIPFPAILNDAFGLKHNPKKVEKADDVLLVEVNSEEQIHSLKPDFEKIKKLECRAVIITALSLSPEFDFVSRVFAPKSGVNEDPVTGSAHCKLAPYWSKLLKKNTFKAFQASKQGGVLYITLKEDRTFISGHVLTKESKFITL